MATLPPPSVAIEERRSQVQPGPGAGAWSGGGGWGGGAGAGGGGSRLIDSGHSPSWPGAVRLAQRDELSTYAAEAPESRGNKITGTGVGVGASGAGTTFDVRRSAPIGR